jgi:hypothetical protein
MGVTTATDLWRMSAAELAEAICSVAPALAGELRGRAVDGQPDSGI